VCDVLRDRDALRLEDAQNGGVVDEVTQDREGAGVSVLVRERDRIANAEAHAEVGRSKDTHYRRVNFTLRNTGLVRSSATTSSGLVAIEAERDIAASRAVSRKAGIFMAARMAVHAVEVFSVR
jgi:hypothetical protein